MNNLIFNTVASELKTNIYAQAPDTSIKTLKLDASNNLLVAGSFTISGIENSITVAEITNPVTIGNETLTVEGSVTVAGTVTVSQVTNTVTVAGTITVGNTSITVAIDSSRFVSDTVSAQELSSTGSLFDNRDISTLKTASIIIYNTGANPVTVSLQVSPTSTTTDYISDPNFTDKVIAASTGRLIIPITLFAHYARIYYDMGAVTTQVTAYFNGQA